MLTNVQIVLPNGTNVMSCDDAEITAKFTFISTHFSLLFLLYFNATHFSETYPRVQINVLSKSRLNFFSGRPDFSVDP